MDGVIADGLCKEWKWGVAVRHVCMHDVVVAGLMCEEEWKWEQLGVVSACIMVLSMVGCVKSGSGSSQAWCMRAWWAV